MCQLGVGNRDKAEDCRLVKRSGKLRAWGGDRTKDPGKKKCRVRVGAWSRQNCEVFAWVHLGQLLDLGKPLGAF